MKNFVVIVEKTEKGGDVWGRIHYEEDLLTSGAADLEKLLNNFKEQLVGFYQIRPKDIKFEVLYELQGFFDTHKYLKISEVARKAKINPGLMQHYASGIKFPSEKQLKKIETAVHSLGKELSSVSLVA